MKKFLVFLPCLFLAAVVLAQQPVQKKLSVNWEALTAPNFVKAVELSGGVCIIPIGVYEKHATHLPLGTDMYDVRAVASKAAEKEYAIVFPTYCFSQINEARSQPGTIAYSNELIWKVLDETCSELSRNGLKKIILLSGHGGNPRFLTFWLENQLSSPRDYEVVLFENEEQGKDPDPKREQEIKSLTKATLDGHAGESETSNMLYLYPELVDKDAINSESGADQDRLRIPYGTTGNGFNWYASYPNHYMGDASQHSVRLGELQIAREADQVAELIKFMKSDRTLQQIKDEFFKKAANPLLTKPFTK